MPVPTHDPDRSVPLRLPAGGKPPTLRLLEHIWYLNIRFPVEPVYLVRSGPGYVLVGPTDSAMPGYARNVPVTLAVVGELQESGMVVLTGPCALPDYAYRRAIDADHGRRVVLTRAGWATAEPAPAAGLADDLDDLTDVS